MPRESKIKKKERFSRILGLLKRYYPDAHCALNFENPDQLLVATILSAQCTDERVNIVTAPLFKKYPTLKEFAKADLKELEVEVKSTGFYRMKAKNILKTAQDICRDHQGQIPLELEVLNQMAGVGRKTANVVLGNAFGLATGVVVDTHVKRLSQRLGFTKSDNPVIIERELAELADKSDWIMLSHWLISHGRSLCKARSPKCELCFLAELCPSSQD